MKPVALCSRWVSLGERSAPEWQWFYLDFVELRFGVPMLSRCSRSSCRVAWQSMLRRPWAVDRPWRSRWRHRTRAANTSPSCSIPFSSNCKRPCAFCATCTRTSRRSPRSRGARTSPPAWCSCSCAKWTCSTGASACSLIGRVPLFTIKK